VGINVDIVTASFLAILSGLNRHAMLHAGHSQAVAV